MTAIPSIAGRSVLQIAKRALPGNDRLIDDGDVQ
jgi:hypothetical protein